MTTKTKIKEVNDRETAMDQLGSTSKQPPRKFIYLNIPLNGARLTPWHTYKRRKHAKL